MSDTRTSGTSEVTLYQPGVQPFSSHQAVNWRTAAGRASGDAEDSARLAGTEREDIDDAVSEAFEHEDALEQKD